MPRKQIVAKRLRGQTLPWRRRRGPPMASPAVWKEGRIVRRTLSLGDDAEIVQSLEYFAETMAAGPWSVVSQTVQEEDPDHTLTGRAVGLRAAKRLADKHVDELRKTWAAENGVVW